MIDNLEVLMLGKIELHWLDWIVIAFYGLVTIAIAVWAMRKIKDTGGLLVGKRKMGPLMIMASSFAGGTNANHPMTVASATYKHGMSGMWISLTWMLITPFFWVYPPALRRLRIVTMVDTIEMRYGFWMGMLFKIAQLTTIPLSLGLGIKSAAIVIEIMSGGAITGIYAHLTIVIPTLIYATLGGVIAAYATDVLQGALIIVLSFLLIPFAISQAGGIEALDLAIDNEFTSLLSKEGGIFTPWWIFWFAIGATSSAALSAAGGASAASNENVARMKIFGLAAKRFCTIGWGLAGLFGLALFATDTGFSGKADDIFPYASAQLLPIVLRGLMVASILAAVMSSLDAGILGFGGMAVNNVYQQHFNPKASAKHYLLMTRIFAGCGLVAGWLIATQIESLVQFTKYVEPVNGVVGLAILTALVWRRVTAWGAIASIAVMAPIFFITAITPYPNGLDQMPYLLKQLLIGMQSFYSWTGVTVPILDNNKIDVPYMYPMYLIPGMTAMIVVSLLTRQHDRHSVDQFYMRLDTPVGEEHKIQEAGYEVDQLEHLDHELPETTKSKGTQRLLMADFLYLPGKLKRGEVQWKDYRMDLIGVALSIVFVVLFIAGIELLGKLF